MPQLRRLRPQVLAALGAGGRETPERFDAAWDAFADIPPKQLFGPLFSALLNPDPVVKWRAVTAFGPTARRLFAESPEDGRILMRNLMWRMSEESGNMGWGIPEAMGEILALTPPLAQDYASILLSYIQDLDKDCNFIDHPPLRRGAYWGVARLAQERPEFAASATRDLCAALKDCDPESRGLACLGLGLRPGGAPPEAVEPLTALLDDAFAFDLYRDRILAQTTVGALARSALAKT